MNANGAGQQGQDVNTKAAGPLSFVIVRGRGCRCFRVGQAVLWQYVTFPSAAHSVLRRPIMRVLA